MYSCQTFAKLAGVEVQPVKEWSKWTSAELAENKAAHAAIVARLEASPVGTLYIVQTLGSTFPSGGRDWQTVYRRVPGGWIQL